MVLLLLAVMATVIPGTLSVTSAWRTCRPPPPCDNVCRNNSLPVCLVVGDSVSIGYTSPFLEAALNGTCTVLHAPFSGDGGACDTRYGLQVLVVYSLFSSVYVLLK